MGSRIVSVIMDEEIWQSILNRSREVKTAVAFEYVCMKFLIEMYPKEKETGMKSHITKDLHESSKKRFQEIVKEVQDKRFNDLIKPSEKNANNS
jgi:hypothetical protein